MSLGAQLEEFFRVARVEAALERHRFFRSAILGSTAGAEGPRHAFRAHGRYRSAQEHFVGIRLMDLESGARRFVPLSPAYRSYGVWNHVDFKRGLVVHHGIGLDAAHHRFGELRRDGKRGPKVRTVDSFLIGRRLELP